uniref:Uncharacterized protein n=1 Tax=Escherichia coli TaxID=562 RepID=A0A2K9UZY7_ECOLX|nr:hypothetical protein [Escherichia coli]
MNLLVGNGSCQIPEAHTGGAKNEYSGSIKRFGLSGDLTEKDIRRHTKKRL